MELGRYLDDASNEIIEKLPNWIRLSRYRTRKSSRPWQYRLTLTMNAPFLDNRKAFNVSHTKRSPQAHELINTLVRIGNHFLRTIDDEILWEEDEYALLKEFVDSYFLVFPPDLTGELYTKIRAKLPEVVESEDESDDESSESMMTTTELLDDPNYDSNEDEDYVFNGTSTDDTMLSDEDIDSDDL